MRYRLLLASVLAFAATLGVLGCAASNTEQSEHLASSALAFDCANPIDILDEPPNGWLAVGDVVALPGDRSLQRGRYDSELGRSFSKFGLVMRADRAFSVTVAVESQPNALIGWGTDSRTPATSIEVTGCAGLCETDWQPNCPLGASGEWVVYPGGVWTIEPACISIEIVTDAETVTAQLPIGKQCS